MGFTMISGIFQHFYQLNNDLYSIMNPRTIRNDELNFTDEKTFKVYGKEFKKSIKDEKSYNLECLNSTVTVYAPKVFSKLLEYHYD